MLRNAVGCRPGDKNIGAAGDRQDAAVVFQKHERLTHSAAGDSPVRIRPDQLDLAGQAAFGWARRVKQAETQLDAEDASNRLVETLQANLAIIDLLQQAGVQIAPAVWCHEHVEPCIEGGGTVRWRAAIDLAMPVPVTDHEPVKAHAIDENIGENRFIAVHLDAVPAVETGHHRLHAGIDRRRIAGTVNMGEVALIGAIIALVDPALRAAITEEMFRCRNDMGVAQKRIISDSALQAFDHGRGIAGNQLRAFRIALIGAAPSVIANHGEGRGECPFLAGDADFSRGDGADLADQIRIVRGPEADIVREKCCPDDIVMAMNRIRSPQGRNADPAIAGVSRGLEIGIRQRQPGGRGSVIVVTRAGIATVEHGAEIVSTDLIGSDRADISLDHLADLLLKRHAGQQFIDPRLHGRIPWQGGSGLGPQFRINLRIIGVRGVDIDHRSRLAGSRPRIIARRRGLCVAAGHRQGQPAGEGQENCPRHDDV